MIDENPTSEPLKTLFLFSISRIGTQNDWSVSRIFTTSETEAKNPKFENDFRTETETSCKIKKVPIPRLKIKAFMYQMKLKIKILFIPDFGSRLSSR